MLGIAPDWEGGIDALVTEANLRLSELLPFDRASRPKDEVNARLVRHYTTEGLLMVPRREGREARYGRPHLLNLLALRRLMADGLGGKALTAALTDRTEEELAQLAQEGNLGLEQLPFLAVTSKPASPLAYIQHLMAGVALGEAPVKRFAASPPDPSPLFSPTASAAVTSQRRKVVSKQVTRVQVMRGLMLEVDETFRTPRNERERQALLDALWASLVDAGQVES